MPEVKLIAALDSNCLIGLDGKLPWRHKADLQRFKTMTMGGTLIMGRKTFESLPSGGLPGRNLVVITRDPHYEAPDLPLIDPFVEVANGLLAAVHMALKLKGKGTVWIAGGAQVYRQALAFKGLVDGVDLTWVPPVPEERLKGAECTYFHPVLEDFEVVEDIRNPDDPSLRHVTYRSKA